MKLEYLKKYEPFIYKRVLECRTRQGNYTNPPKGLSLIYSRASGNFNWNATEEGTKFWEAIDKGNFDVFYDKYPLLKLNKDEYSIF